MNEYDPGYKETEEHHRLGQARLQASAEGNPCSASIVVAPTTRSSGRTQEIRFAFTSDQEPHVQAIVGEILTVFPGFEPILPEIGNAIVPDVDPS